MTAQELCSALSLKVFALPEPDRTACGGYAGDLLSWVMGRAKGDNVWLTIMSNRNIIAVATLADVTAVVLTEGVVPDEGVAELAEQRGINLLGSDEPTYELAAKLAALGV